MAWDARLAGWLRRLLAHDDATPVVACLDMLRYPREGAAAGVHVCVCASGEWACGDWAG
jgi:hypothetical protein